MSRHRSKVPSFGPCRTPFRCWLNDLDALMHMNNGRYFSIMDLARVDLMIRSGLFKRINDNGWYPVVVAETARFRRSLKLFESFEVETEVIGWDKKATLLRQKFLRGDDIVCEAVVRARFLKKAGGSVSSEELLEVAGRAGEMSPELEPWVRAWNEQQSL